MGPPPANGIPQPVHRRQLRPERRQLKPGVKLNWASHPPCNGEWIGSFSNCKKGTRLLASLTARAYSRSGAGRSGGVLHRTDRNRPGSEATTYPYCSATRKTCAHLTTLAFTGEGPFAGVSGAQRRISRVSSPTLSRNVAEYCPLILRLSESGSSRVPAASSACGSASNCARSRRRKTRM